MNNIKEFLLQQANKIVNHFDDIKIRVSHNELSDIHFVEIHPESSFNDELKLYLSYILDDFFEKFPHDSVSFVSESNLIDSQDDDQWIVGKNNLQDWSIWFNSQTILFDVDPIECNDLYFIAA